MKKKPVLQAAIENGGFDLALVGDMTAQDIREYFTADNFSRMFPGDDNSHCGGYSLTECANAVIDELGL